MSSSSEGLRDERRICRIHFSMRITDVAYETTCHGRRSSPSDSLIAGATAMMVRPRFTMIDVLGALWGRVGRQGSERQGTCQAKGWRCAVLLFRVVNSRSWCVVKPVTTTKRVRNAGTWQHRSRRPPMHPRCGVGVHENGSRPFRRHVPRRCARRGAVCACRSTSALFCVLGLYVYSVGLSAGAEKMPPM